MEDKIIQALNFIGADPADFNLKNSLFLKPIEECNRESWHGIGHLYRVMIGTALLAQSIDKPREGFLAFCGAYIHDLARVNDGHDPYQGLRAAEEKFDSLSHIVTKYNVTPQEQDYIRAAVASHSGSRHTYQYNRDVAAILADADALDRCRFRRHGRLEPQKLRYDESLHLIELIEKVCRPTREWVKEISFSEFIKRACSGNTHERRRAGVDRRIAPDKIKQLHENQIFVFNQKKTGYSRLATAELAYKSFDADKSVGEGLTGKAYAIPTDYDNLYELGLHIEQFILFAREHTEFVFLVTKIGCGGAGRRVDEIAPLFRKAIGVSNIWLPKEFLNYINDNPENSTTSKHDIPSMGLYLKEGNFVLGYDVHEIGTKIDFEDAVLVPVGDCSVQLFALVKRDNKYGFFLFYSGGMGGYMFALYDGGKNPFVYDEIMVSEELDLCQNYLYILFRVNTNWGLARINAFLGEKLSVEIVIPCIYPGREEVLAKIKRGQYNWYNPFNR